MRRLCAFLLASFLALSCAGDGESEGAERVDRSTTTTDAPTSTATSEAPSSSSSSSATSPSSSSTAPPVTTRTTRRPVSPSTPTTAPPGTTATPVPPTTPTTAAPVALSELRLKLTKVATFDEPLALAQRRGDDTFYVAEKRGRVRALRGGQVGAEPVLDLSGEVSVGSEQGLLGLAFSPDGNLLYASFTNRDGDTRLWEYAFRDGKADLATKREVLRFDQPFPNHNGGQVMFGPDGFMYFFLGDGGSGGDPNGNGQRLDTLLGKILRIDPTPPTPGAEGYTIPADNPFVGRADARGEIWAYGLRNPWRNSFDRLTEDLWIGDVGQNQLEEIDVVTRVVSRGANFGWNYYEGSKRFNPNPIAPKPENYVPPVHEYPTNDGCAVTGGYVYRGTAIPGLTGAYFFGDFCNGEIQALRLTAGRVGKRRNLGLVVENLASFGEDRNGELYAFSLSGGLYRIDAG